MAIRMSAGGGVEKHDGFVNWGLMNRLFFITCMVVLMVVTVVAFIQEDYVEACLYLVLAYALAVSDALNRINSKVSLLMEAFTGIMHAFPVFGQGLDNIMRQSIDTNRFIMHKLLTDEEKAELIELTNQMQDSDSADALARWLFESPVDELTRKQKEESETELN